MTCLAQGHRAHNKAFVPSIHTVFSVIMNLYTLLAAVLSCGPAVANAQAVFAHFMVSSYYTMVKTDLPRDTDAKIGGKHKGLCIE